MGLHCPVEDSEDAWFGHGGAWGTQCTVNWHKKQLRMLVIQSNGGPKSWNSALEKAQQDFLESKFDNKAAEAYTGRTE